MNWIKADHLQEGRSSRLHYRTVVPVGSFFFFHVDWVRQVGETCSYQSLEKPFIHMQLYGPESIAHISFLRILQTCLRYTCGPYLTQSDIVHFFFCEISMFRF